MRTPNMKILALVVVCFTIFAVNPGNVLADPATLENQNKIGKILTGNLAYSKIMDGKFQIKQHSA